MYSAVCIFLDLHVSNNQTVLILDNDNFILFLSRFWVSFNVLVYFACWSVLGLSGVLIICDILYYCDSGLGFLFAGFV